MNRREVVGIITATDLLGHKKKSRKSKFASGCARAMSDGVDEILSYRIQERS